MRVRRWPDILFDRPSVDSDLSAWNAEIGIEEQMQPLIYKAFLRRVWRADGRVAKAFFSEPSSASSDDG